MKRIPIAVTAAAGIAAVGMILAGCAVIENLASPSVAANNRQERIRKTSYVAPHEVAKSPRNQPTDEPDLSGCGTNNDCRSQLKELLAEDSLTWISRSPSTAELSTGARLLAYRTLRPKLTCGQLTHALADVDVVTRTLHNPVQDVSADQVDRVRILNAQVENELRAEQAKRCGV
jgi:hypothetical protein